MIDENHTPTRARVAATMHLWGLRRVPDGMIREIIRDLNAEAQIAPHADLLRRIADV